MSFFKKYWLIIISFLTIGISGFFLYGSFVEYYTYPFIGIVETISRSVTYAFIVFFVANSLRKRLKRKSSEFWILCFAISFSLCASHDLIKTNKLSTQLSNSRQELSRLARDLDKRPLPESVNEYSTEQFGIFSPLFPLIRHSFEFSEQVAAEINAACANLENVLIPANLCEYENIIQAKDLVASFTAKLNSYEKKYDEEFTFMQSKIKEAFFENANLKKQALIGFEKGKKKSNKLMKKFFYIEKESVKRIDNILNFLSTKLGNFWESDGTFIFENDDDVDMFNQLAQSLAELIQKEDVIFKKLEMHRQSVLQKMANFDKDYK